MKLYELTALELAGQLRAGAVTQAEAISTAAGFQSKRFVEPVHCSC